MIWTLPNLLTMARVLAAPAVALCFVVLDRPLSDQVALAVFVVAAATDFLDGWLARRTGQTSAFGAMLDPIADKAMVAIALAVLTALHGPQGWLMVPVALILLREVVISGLREYLGEVKLPVTRLARAKTAVQMGAIALLLLAGSLGAEPALTAAGAGALWFAALLTVVTGWDYLRRGTAQILARDGQGAR